MSDICKHMIGRMFILSCLLAAGLCAQAQESRSNVDYVTVRTKSALNRDARIHYRVPEGWREKSGGQLCRVLVYFGGRNCDGERIVAGSALGLAAWADENSIFIVAPSFKDDDYWEPEKWSGEALMSALQGDQEKLSHLHRRTSLLRLFGGVAVRKPLSGMEAESLLRMGLACLRSLLQACAGHEEMSGACHLRRRRRGTLHHQPEVCRRMPQTGHRRALEVIPEPSARCPAGLREARHRVPDHAAPTEPGRPHSCEDKPEGPSCACGGLVCRR